MGRDGSVHCEMLRIFTFFEGLVPRLVPLTKDMLLRNKTVNNQQMKSSETDLAVLPGFSTPGCKH